MKIIGKRERGYRFYSEKYDLNGVYAGKKDVPIGVLILYALVKNSDVVFAELTAEAEGDLGEPHNILTVSASDMGVFDSLNGLANTFASQELNIWELVCDYKGTHIFITGRTYGSILGIRSPLVSSVNLLPLMSDVETATYNYHDYNPATIEAIKDRFKMNQKVTIQTLIEMEKQKDIFQEFMNGMKGNSFVFPDTDAVSVEGFTAQYLHENYPLSEIGSYNYLVYLRNNPKQAKMDLEQGLPKK